jgi:U5 small nuclear ribonucleoprotein component
MYPGAEIMIEQEDRQTLETPLVSTEAEKNYDHEEPLTTYYETQYLLDLMVNPALVRNVCVAGHLHHGKTLLLDMVVQQTHLRKPTWNLEKNYRWLDTRIDEQEKQLSIKATPITLLLPDLHGKHYVFNFVDSPGHPNFLGEVAAGLRVC